LGQLKSIVDEEALATILLPPDAALASMPFVDLSPHDAQRARQGIAVPLSEHSAGVPTAGEDVRMRDEAEKLIAVGRYDEVRKALHPRVVIAGNEI
jgi:tRNA U55 pseudouridine synthase TruB